MSFDISGLQTCRCLQIAKWPCVPRLPDWNRYSKHAPWTLAGTQQIRRWRVCVKDFLQHYFFFAVPFPSDFILYCKVFTMEKSGRPKTWRRLNSYWNIFCHLDWKNWTHSELILASKDPKNCVAFCILKLINRGFFTIFFSFPLQNGFAGKLIWWVIYWKSKNWDWSWQVK